jgi:hypothetical protein
MRREPAEQGIKDAVAYTVAQPKAGTVQTQATGSCKGEQAAVVADTAAYALAIAACVLAPEVEPLALLAVVAASAALSIATTNLQSCMAGNNAPTN